MKAVAWTRTTKWRQGSALPRLVSVSLGLISDDQDSQVAIIISHDCDVVEDNLTNEPTVEVIVGRYIDDPDSNHTHAKSPNRLHLQVSVATKVRTLELLASQKQTVAKSALADANPDFQIILDAKSRNILQNWLALRYRRATFPDALNAHLAELRDVLQKIGKRNPKAIIGFFLDFEPEGEITSPDEPYELWIVVVFDHISEGAKAVADEATQRIYERLRRKFQTAAGWKNIELRECTARSDSEFTLFDATAYHNFPLDYISLRSTD